MITLCFTIISTYVYYFVDQNQGGWELDESKKEAAVRETIEEAGGRGIVGVSKQPNKITQALLRILILVLYIFIYILCDLVSG